MGTDQKHNFSHRLFLNEPDGFAHGLGDSTIRRYSNRQLDAGHDRLPLADEPILAVPLSELWER